MVDDSFTGGAQSHQDARDRSASCWEPGAGVGGLVNGLVCREEETSAMDGGSGHTTQICAPNNGSSTLNTIEKKAEKHIDSGFLPFNASAHRVWRVSKGRQGPAPPRAREEHLWHQA